jgi:hypothetical protein
LAASLDPWDAARELGWRKREFDSVVAERSVTAGRFGRDARADVAALAADEELAERVDAERILDGELVAAASGGRQAFSALLERQRQRRL